MSRYSKDAPNGPRILQLATGVLLKDAVKEINQANDLVVMMTSKNCRWIAAESEQGDVFLWELRGINLADSCKMSDRLLLDELRQQYELGLERNQKLGRNYVVRLSLEQWSKFQELSKRAECEVPDEWRKLFKPMK